MPSFTKMEPCCYGFIHTGEQLPGAVWCTEVQRPFRAHWLWVWDEPPGATLLSLKVALDEHLVQHMPFAAMGRSIEPWKFLQLGLLEGQSAPQVESNATTVLLNGARVHSMMARDFDRPAIEMRAAKVGEQLSAICKGKVRGVVLVGWEVP